MPNTGRKKEKRDKNIKTHESLVKKSLDPPSYDMWVFENYTKERLKALGIIN